MHTDAIQEGLAVFCWVFAVSCKVFCLWRFGSLWEVLTDADLWKGNAPLGAAALRVAAPGKRFWDWIPFKGLILSAVALAFAPNPSQIGRGLFLSIEPPLEASNRSSAS